MKDQKILMTIPHDMFETALEELLQASLYWQHTGRICGSYLLGLWNGDHFRPDIQKHIALPRNLQENIIIVLAYLSQNDKQLIDVVNEKRMIPIIQSWGHVCATKSYSESIFPSTKSIN